MDSTGHDYYHAERVARLADRLAETEQPDERERGISHIGREALEQIGHILDECGIDEAGIV